MKMMKLHTLALVIATASGQMAYASSQSESDGFVEGSKLDVFSRALYFNRDFRDGAGNIPDASKSSGFKNGYAEETGLGVRVLFESGFTQGTVGVGVDAHSLSSVVLDSGKGRYGSGQFGQTDDGSADKTQSEVGAALKLRVSDTVLKYGNQIVSAPVFATNDSRILPEVATGLLITSGEINGLDVTLGRFTGLSSQTGTARDDLELTTLTLGGLSYKFSDALTGALFASHVEDHFDKRYLNLNYVTGPLSFDFNAYRTTDTGQKLSGELDNTIWSLAGAYSVGAHTFTLAHQRSTGNSAYAYGIDGGGTVYLANSVQLMDFDQEDERSWQVRYDVDMAAFGVPGLSFMARYVRGDNINLGADLQEGQRWERNLEARYVVQQGAAKDLSFRVRQATYRSSDADAIGVPDIDEVRLIAEYPLNIF